MSGTAFAHRNLPRLLLQAREAVMQHTRPSLREHGLSDQQWRVLRVLGEHAREPGGIETGRIAREAFLLGPSLTGVLTRMERDGLIARERCSQDARPSRTRGTATAMRRRRTAPGNCFFSTNSALAATASAITTYCASNAESINRPPAPRRPGR